MQPAFRNIRSLVDGDLGGGTTPKKFVSIFQVRQDFENALRYRGGHVKMPSPSFKPSLRQCSRLIITRNSTDIRVKKATRKRYMEFRGVARVSGARGQNIVMAPLANFRKITSEKI